MVKKVCQRLWQRVYVVRALRLLRLCFLSSHDMLYYWMNVPSLMWRLWVMDCHHRTALIVSSSFQISHAPSHRTADNAQDAPPYGRAYVTDRTSPQGRSSQGRRWADTAGALSSSAWWAHTRSIVWHGHHGASEVWHPWSCISAKEVHRGIRIPATSLGQQFVWR